MQTTNTPRIKRTAANVAQLLSDLLRESADFEKRSRKLRLKINVDLKALVKELPAEDRGRLVSIIAVRVQEIFNSAGSPKVKISGGCVGQGGFGVRVEEGGNYGGVCVMGSLDKGITGGGFEAGTTY